MGTTICETTDSSVSMAGFFPVLSFWPQETANIKIMNRRENLIDFIGMNLIFQFKVTKYVYSCTHPLLFPPAEAGQALSAEAKRGNEFIYSKLEALFLALAEGRPSRNCPVGNFRKEPVYSKGVWGMSACTNNHGVTISVLSFST